MVYKRHHSKRHLVCLLFCRFPVTRLFGMLQIWSAGLVELAATFSFLLVQLPQLQYSRTLKELYYLIYFVLIHVVLQDNKRKAEFYISPTNLTFSRL
jgi:hypothetical protein